MIKRRKILSVSNARYIVYVGLIMFCTLLRAESLTLYDAVYVHVYNTKSVKVQYLALDNALMECANFRKSYLPALQFNLSPISFNRSLRLLQNYATGEYSNVEEYSNTSQGGVSISQKVAATGGVFTVGSNISFLRQFSSNTNSFSSTPLYVSYRQQLRGGHRTDKLERLMSQARSEVAKKEFCISLSQEQQRIVALYMDAYTCKIDVDFYTQTANIDQQLVARAKICLDAGRFTPYEYNQVEIQQLDDNMSLTQCQYAYDNALRQLANELQISAIELPALVVDSFPIYIDEAMVVELVSRNNPQYQRLEMNKLNAEYALHQTKISNAFNADISLSYGLNQYAPTFREAYQHPDQQQAVQVSLSVPIFQWGIRRNKLKMAQNEYDSALEQQSYEIDNFKEEIHNAVVNYNMSRSMVEVADKKFHLAAEQYAFAVKRFDVEKISALELTNANREYLQAKQSYIMVLKNLLQNYYQLRHIALYDFVAGKDVIDTIEILKELNI